MIHDEEKLIEEIKQLSELEFSAVLKQMAEHLRRNNWEHIINACFDIETYENEYEDMKDERDEWRDKAKKAEMTIDKIKELV